MSVLLVPATRENLETSIENSVDLEFARKYLDEKLITELLRLSGNEGIRCWAVTKNKRKLYNDIRKGDEVLLTEKGTGLFSHYGIVIGKTRNVEFGMANFWSEPVGIHIFSRQYSKCQFYKKTNYYPVRIQRIFHCPWGYNGKKRPLSQI